MKQRQERAVEVYTRLFGERDANAPDPHPEFGEILRNLIFGEVFATGELDDRTRELVTVTAIASIQAIPQLKAHVAAALNVGATPAEVQESLYQLAPVLGFPRTLNAVTAMSEVFAHLGIELPLAPQGTVTEANRLARGREIQEPLYGLTIRDALADLPEPFADAVPDFLSAFMFGDMASRGGLDPATRELLVLVALVALRHERQIPSHSLGAVRAGNSLATVIAALVHSFPYIGIPGVISALRIMAESIDELKEADSAHSDAHPTS